MLSTGAVIPSTGAAMLSFFPAMLSCITAMFHADADVLLVGRLTGAGGWPWGRTGGS